MNEPKSTGEGLSSRDHDAAKDNPYAGKRVRPETPRKAAKFDEQDGRELFTVIGGARPALDATTLDDCRLSCSGEATCKGFLAATPMPAR